MNLIIKQSNTPESVTAELVDKLYQLTKPDPITGQPAANAVLVGRLQAPAAYEDAVNFLNTQFSSSQDNGSDLQIAVLNNNYYIRFADPEVEEVIKAALGKDPDEGVLSSELSSFQPNFNGNTVIEYFDEMKYCSPSVRDNAFSNCTNLKSIDLSNVTSMSGNGFYFRGCINLEYFHGINGERGVLNLTNLTNASFNNWFFNCKKLERITSLGFISTIRPWAFAGCSALESVTGINSVASIGSSAFEDCTNLETVNLPLLCIDLGSRCFKSDSKLHTINLSHVTAIRNNAFEGCSSLEYCDGPNSTQGELNLPNLTGTLGDNAFKGCTKLTSIASLGSITSIGSSAFENCTNLATINFPSTITSVGKNAFNNTAWFNNRPNGVVYVNTVAYAIKGNTSSTITLNSNTNRIVKSFLGNHNEVTSLILNEGLEIIEEDALTNNHLQTFHLPSTVNSFGNNRCFIYANTITVANDNTKYDSRDNCNAIIETATNTLLSGCPSTVIPNTVTKIGFRAFNSCPITSITIPNSVTIIRTYAFVSCKNIDSIIIPDSVTTIESRTFDFTNIDTSKPDAICLSGGITFGTGLTKIEQQTFCSCKFTSLDLPANITTIENYAIDGCRYLQSIIMRGVTSIGDRSFRGSVLTSITIETPSVPTIHEKSFKNDNGQYINNGNFTIYVPSNLLSSYQTASNWSTLYNDGKIQAIPTT